MTTPPNFEPSAARPTKVRIVTWVLAGAYAACGMGAMIVVPQFQRIYTDMLPKTTLPLLTRVVLLPTPLGLLFLALATAGFLIVKDVFMKPRWLNALFAVLLVIAILCLLVALFSPLRWPGGRNELGAVVW